MDNTVSIPIHDLVPLLRQLALGDYGIALGGAHAKGVDDVESDIDLYLFARRTYTNTERERMCRIYSADITDLVCWGDAQEDGVFTQTGSDFFYQQRKIECWTRSIESIEATIDECRRGMVKQELVTWTVMGFYNHCTLSDIRNMQPLEDPTALLSRWKAIVSVYPPALRKAIISRHLRAAQFWPHNFHYQSAIERCDVIYTTGIIQQVVHNLIQVVFALNETYFPGDKKLEAALAHLDRQPPDFAARVRRLLSPGAPAKRALLDEQRGELCALLQEVETLAGVGS